MKKKEKYTVPLCKNIRIIENTSIMLSFSVHPDQETEIVGGKEQGEFVEEEVAPTAPDLWGDDED